MNSGNRYEGRLELTWTNKDRRLLAEDDGSYTWLPPADYRVAEVRLLHSGSEIGTPASKASRAANNLLIRGDALYALNSLTQLPEFSRVYSAGIRLAYLDPPFNTQQSFLHYDDALEHSVWLTMMRDRLMTIKDLLSTDGSVWVHCDDSEQAYLRVMMDEVFGRDKFVATIIWEKRFSRSNDASFSVSHDFLVVYATNPDTWAKIRNRLKRSSGQAKIYKNPDNDPRGPWRLVPWDAPNIRPNLSYPIATPSGKLEYPPKGRHWSRIESKWLQIVDDGLAYFGKNGAGSPMFKTFLKDDPGIVPNTWWSHEETGHSSEAKREILGLFPKVEAFATPKPERLMQRIIEIATNPGDIVLDCFLGSGTTAAVAHKMGRRWVGIEREQETVDTFAVPRLSMVVNGEDKGGVTNSEGWQGGGGFRILDVAPSMFRAEEGQVFLSEWATNGKLAEVTAAQLHFDYEYDPPFTGRRGRVRLAVIDGLVNEDVVHLLLTSLPESERLVACGTAIDPSAKEVIQQLRPGSTVRKIPQSILQEYRLNERRRQPIELVEAK